MAYTYSSYAGSLRPESSLPTIEEGLSHLQDSSNSEDAIHQLRNQQHIIHSPKNSNFLPPGHQSPTTRIVSGGSSSSGTAVDRISTDGKPPRSRHGTADSIISNGSNISLNESELFRGAQYALAHLQESIHSQEQEITATSVALSQHYRHAHLDRTERIEDANLTGISQVPKTPGSTTRRTYGNDMVESPSLPSSLRNALATPRSKSVTFAPSPPGSPSPAQQQDAASELSAGSEPEIDGLSTSEQAMLSEWTRIPPSESSPPSSRSIARNSPRRSPSPLDAPLQQQQSEVEIQPEAEVESQFAVESSPSPSPRSSSALLRTNRRSISPSLHTSVAHTPSRLRNVVTLTDTESSVDSNHAPEEEDEDEDLSHERSPPPSRPSSRQAHSSPHRLSRTPVQSLPQPPTAFLPIPFSSPLAQSLTQAKSPATLTGTSTGTAVTAGTGTFATAESFQTAPSSTGTRTSTLSGTKEAGDSHELHQGLPPPRFPSLFGADTSFSVERDEEPVVEEEEEKEEEDEMVRSIEDSLSRLTRAAQLISSATASAFAQIGGRQAADTEMQDKLEEDEEAAGETSQTIEELAHGANLVQEMHELHAALQANLLRRLQAAERGQVREREERVQLEGNVKRLVVGLMKGDSVSGEEDGALAEEGEEMEMLFGKFRAWALHMGSMKDRLENSSSVGPEPAGTSRSSNSKTETDRLLSLQSELDRLTAELEIAEQAHLTIQARVAEVESERDELKDEQGVFELELSNVRRERDQLRSEAEDVAEELSLAERRISVLEVQVAEESAGRSQADAYRRRLEEGFEAQLADLRRELEDLRRENVKLEEGRRQVEERGREEVGGAVRALREREREVEKLLSDLGTERQMRARLEREREELIAAIPIPDEKDDEDQEEALLASKLEEAEGKVGLQASRIKELEKESANADLEIAKLLKVRDRMEQENANYAMALAAKQQELSLLKRNTGRTSAANMTTAAAATPLGLLKTPRANDKHRQDQADPLSTVRRRPPTAVLQSLILNTEKPLPSSRIAHRSRMSGLHQASSGKEDAYTTTTEEEEERSEIGDEVTPLRAGQGLTKGSRVLGERGGVPASSSNGAGSKPRLSSRASLGSAVRASRVAVNDENAPPPPPPLPSRGSSATSSTGTSLNGGGARRARSSLGAGALSGTATTSAAATRASAVGARRTSLGVVGNSGSRTERPSRAIAPSPTPSMASVTSTSSVASSGYTSTSTSNSIASTSTRTGVLRSAAAARKSGVGVDSRMMASTPTPASASGRGASSGSVLGRERTVNRPRESGVRVASGSSSSVRASGSKASTTSVGPSSSSSARTALKRSSPDEEPEPIKAPPQQQHHHSASASAASSSSRSTVVPRLSRTQQLGASSLSTHSLSQSSRSVSNGSVRDEEMTEEELSGSVGPMMPSASGSGASLGARRVVSGRLSDVASSRAGPSGPRPGSSVPGGARRPSYGLAGSAARVPSYERRMLPA
ncbi:hypothetical protein CF327_g762 [Tilletia walkeri]|nr:hypothetical protein CF327_g762 [Tilletia walkeri]